MQDRHHARAHPPAREDRHRLALRHLDLRGGRPDDGGWLGAVELCRDRRRPGQRHELCRDPRDVSCRRRDRGDRHDRRNRRQRRGGGRRVSESRADEKAGRRIYRRQHGPAGSAHGPCRRDHCRGQGRSRRQDGGIAQRRSGRRQIARRDRDDNARRAAGLNLAVEAAARIYKAGMADLDGTTFLTGANAGFIAELYARFLTDPNSVDESWRRFFSDTGDDLPAVLTERRGPAWSKPTLVTAADGAAPVAEFGAEALRQAAIDSICALNLIRAYRVRGHLEADLDPLGLEKREPYPELDYHSYGFTEADLGREIFINNLFGRERATLGEIVALLRATYCGTIGVEYMHIQVPAERAWIQEKYEKQKRPELSTSIKKEILQILTTAETFERFLDRRYTGTKRFGIEGAESLMPALEAILRRGSELGIREFVIGMPHRGRLNVLANFVGKPFAAIFSEFQGSATQLEHVHGSGDVKYHLGTSGDRKVGGQTVHLSLAANPSHLEAVDPVVLGKVRAKQYQRDDQQRSQVAGILMHGDAAFAGQGLVAEALELANLIGFCTGGTIHIIVNNQIGFTTAPAQARSSPYPSDVAKGVQAPIFHVNGDDPEAVVEVARVAVEFREEFRKDVVVDLFCYRRHGHNETDEPAFTQPMMYRTIAHHPTTRQIYAKRLVEAGVLRDGEPDAMAAGFIAELETQFETAKSYRPNKADWLEGAWAGIEQAPDDDRRGETGVGSERLREIGRGLVTVPEGFRLNPKIARQLEAKRASIEAGEGIDWATAEAFAVASLCAEGTHV